MNLDGFAAYFAVFHVSLVDYRRIEHHRDDLPAVRAREEEFHAQYILRLSTQLLPRLAVFLQAFSLPPDSKRLPGKWLPWDASPGTSQLRTDATRRVVAPSRPSSIFPRKPVARMKKRILLRTFAILDAIVMPILRRRWQINCPLSR